MKTDDGGVGSVYAGLAQLFRILRNARSANRLNPLGPLAAQGSFVAAVEDTAPSPGGSVGTRVRPRLASNTAVSGRGPWYLVRAKALSVGRSKCLLRIARTSVLVRGLLASPSRTAVYGPVRTVVSQGSAGDRRPMPIKRNCSLGQSPPHVCAIGVARLWRSGEPHPRGSGSALRVRTCPPASPATTRRSSTNAPQCKRFAAEGGDEHASVKRALSVRAPQRSTPAHDATREAHACQHTRPAS